MAQRALAELMARHLWPAGIHVALIVVDGVVGGPVTRSRFTDRADDFFIAPDGIAAIAADLVKQRPRGLELRGRSAAVQGEMVKGRKRSNC